MRGAQLRGRHGGNSGGFDWYYINAFKCICFCVFVELKSKINYFTDKATDPSKTKDDVDYSTPVCDRINVDLDG